MAITLRQTSTDPTGKASALTHQEMNDNLKSYYQSSSLSGSTLELHTVSDTHSVDLSSLGGGSSVDISDLNTFSGSAEDRLDSIEAVTSSYLTPADTGSLYLSSSVDQNRITFTQGDGSTQTVVIETGSADDSITYFTESVVNNIATWDTSFDVMHLTSAEGRIAIERSGNSNCYTATNSVDINNTGGDVKGYTLFAANNTNHCLTTTNATAISNFSGKTTASYSIALGALYSNLTAPRTFLLGGEYNCTQGTNSCYSGVVGGGRNCVSGFSSIILGGLRNVVNTATGATLAGVCNTVLGTSSTVVGGNCNKINSGTCSNITGGDQNILTANNSIILSSKNTSLSGDASLVFSPTSTTVVEARENIARFDVTLLEVSGALSASGLSYPTADGTAGQVITTDGSGVLSFSTISGGSTTDTGSFYVSSSINGSSITYLQGDGSTEVVNIPAGGVDTGSFYVSSSVDRNVVTFTQGDGTVETITIETGSADDVITEWIESSSGGNSTWTSTTALGVLDSTSHMMNVGSCNATLSGDRSAIVAGCKNQVTSADSITLGGCCIRVTGNCSGILSGRLNRVSSVFAAIVGGYDNTVTGAYGFIASSDNSSVSSNKGTILAGNQSSIVGSSFQAVIIGGTSVQIQGSSCYSGVFSSESSIIDDSHRSAILGGLNNCIKSNAHYGSIVGSCKSCVCNSSNSGIFAGSSNRIVASSNDNLVAGGSGNCMNGTSRCSALLSSANSLISNGSTSVILGGASNTLSGNNSVILGGISITETRDRVTRIGGDLLEVDGHFSASGLLYPTASGTVGQVITTDGSGVLSFTTVGGGGASTLEGLTDTDLSPTMDSGSLLYWNGDKWIADNTPHTLGIQDANTLGNVATPNTNDVILFEEGEGLAISYDTNTVTFDLDLDFSSSYEDGTQASSVWRAQGTGTHINAVLESKGTGATTAQVPDGAVTGGNLRGGYATDFQKLRNDANQVASGPNSVVVGGSCNRAYGNHSSVLGGQENIAGGTFSTVLGGYQSCVGSSGTYSTALGNRAQVNALGSFLFRDGSGTTPYVLTDNNTAAFVASKFYVEGTHEVSGSSFSSVGTPDTSATSPTSVSVTIDADDHNFFELSLATGTTHTIGIANGQPGQTLVIKTVQPSSGTVGSVTWTGTTNIKEAFDADNTVTALNDAEDIFTLVSFGTDWYLNGIKRFS
jgi:hypothetical protein